MKYSSFLLICLLEETQCISQNKSNPQQYPCLSFVIFTRIVVFLFFPFPSLLSPSQDPQAPGQKFPLHCRRLPVCYSYLMQTFKNALDLYFEMCHILYQQKQFSICMVFTQRWCTYRNHYTITTQQDTAQYKERCLKFSVQGVRDKV